MNPPVPAPRAETQVKKPVPTPRRSVPKTGKDDDHNKTIEETQPTNNTFSRRVRSLSNASKQIAEDIGGMVQDSKKAMIEGTRQSVRRITRRFNSYHASSQSDEAPGRSDEDDDENPIDIFSSITFESPLGSNAPSIYSNVDVDGDELGAPPPAHPPPPLPVDVVYDAPASTSGTTSSSDQSNVSPFQPQNYECVFPIYGNNNSDCDLSRSGSWQFYDPVVNKNLESMNIYDDIMCSLSNSSNNNGTNVPSEISSIEVRNSLYENHVIVAKCEDDMRRNQRAMATQSVILQFDPLKEVNPSSPPAASDDPPLSPSADIRILEELLQGELYGNISAVNTLDDWSISNDSEPDDFITPPPPPVRFDSLPEDEQPQGGGSAPTTPRDKPKTSWFTSSSTVGGDSSPGSSNGTNKDGGDKKKEKGWLRHVKGVLEKAPDVMRGSLGGVSKSRDFVVQRPELEVKSFVHKKGMLYKVQGGPVEDLFGEYSGRWCVLQSSNFVCYSDNTCDSIKEHFPSESILSIQILQDPKFKYKYDNDDLHCFELNITGKSRGGHIYGARDISERRIWMQCLAESLTKKFSTKITTDYSRMGWAYLREGVSGKWQGAWLMLSHRSLYYVMDHQPVKTMDLRKVRCMVLQVYQESDNNPRTNDRGPNMVVDSHNMTLYLRMWTSRETKVWCHIVKLAAHNNGANLDQQQLTKNNIPVLVEKCINFIYARGSMSEGIYRRPGIGTSVSEILTKFRKDAWAVQLTGDKYTDYDVATALKRFFRDLPEPLLSSTQRQYFHQVSLVKDKEERIRMYKAALEQLHPISYNTSKKLLSHLHFIVSQSSKNLMTVENLAAIWGPTLMHYEDKDGASHLMGSKHVQDAAVVKHLIELYRCIFPEDPSEVEQEKIMLQVLERIAKSPQGAVASSNKKAGDFRVWIYLRDREGKTVNVAIGPNKSAYEVCVDLSAQMKLPVHHIILEEVVLNGKLTRPIHHSEKVLDVVLRWGYWDEADRKDNYLTLVPISKFFEFIHDNKSPLSGELKFADTKSRSFKMYMFEFSQAKLSMFRDKTCEFIISSWNIEDVIWYLGNESKRSPQPRWTVTFIETKTYPKRTKTSPYFGNILVFPDPTTRASWLAAMLGARHGESLTPPAMHVNLMSA